MASAALIPGYEIYDSHVHVWEHNGRFPFAPGAKVPGEDASPETLLRLMVQNGIAKTVIIQVIHYRYDNSYLADVLRRYPGKFVGVCRVDPLDPAAPDRLSQLTEQGFQGVRLSPAGDASGDWIGGPLMRPLWHRCEDLRVPMTLLAPITRMQDLHPLIERHSDLRVVIDHIADCPVDQPEKLDALLALSRYPKVFVKISHTWSLSKQDYPWLDAQELAKRLHDRFGAHRLMWGTDWPIAKERATYTQRLTVVRDQMKFLKEEDKRWILSKTVAHVWPKLNRS
ncbi:MAG: amidohydrolase family protein [Bryobacteraceae bacterium]